MIKNNIKLNQIIMLFVAFSPITKILMLPPILAGYADNMLILPQIINFLCDIILLFIILKINDLFPNQTFFSVIEENFGTFLAKLTYFLYGAFFLLKTTIPLLEQKYFVDNTLYEVFPNFISFFPILLLTFYASIKGLKVIGRCAQICFFTTISAFLIMVALSFSSCDFSNILPLKSPRLSYFLASRDTAMWYFDSIYMLFFIGHFDNAKNKNKKIMLSYFLSCVLCSVATIMFYGVFGKISKIMNFALADMTVFTAKIINIGRIDYFALFMALFSSIFAICLPILSSSKCFERAFGLKKSFIPAIIVNVILFVALSLFEQKFFSIFAFFKTYLSYVMLFLGYVLPLIFYLILRLKKICKNLKIA